MIISRALNKNSRWYPSWGRLTAFLNMLVVPCFWSALVGRREADGNRSAGAEPAESSTVAGSLPFDGSASVPRLSTARACFSEAAIGRGSGTRFVMPLWAVVARIQRPRICGFGARHPQRRRPRGRLPLYLPRAAKGASPRPRQDPRAGILGWSGEGIGTGEPFSPPGMGRAALSLLANSHLIGASSWPQSSSDCTCGITPRLLPNRP